MVSGRTRLDSDQARWQCPEETRDIVTSGLRSGRFHRAWMMTRFWSNDYSAKWGDLRVTAMSLIGLRWQAS